MTIKICMLTFLIIIINVFNTYECLKTIYESGSCMFIGCSCNYDQIKCPASDSDRRFTMFPKRSEYDMTDRNVTLDLSENSIELIPDDRFSHLKFYKINMSSNYISRISTYSFRDIRDLSILDLSSNLLYDITAESMVYFKKTLRTLILENNMLFKMDQFHLSNAMEKLGNIANLNLARNGLIDMPTLNNLQNLEILYFASNKISKLVNPKTYKCLLPSSLIELHLQHNKLQTIYKYSFHRLKNLKYLNLAFNQISEISEDSFRYLTNLRELNLRNNHLKHIPSKIFYTLINLNYLDLSSQKARLEKINNYAFDRISNTNTISFIDLTNNYINEIDNLAFCSANKNYHVNIQRIDLEENNLKIINSCVMKQLAHGYPKIDQKVTLTISKYNNNFTNHNLLTCSCELMQASRFVDFRGDCIDEKNEIHEASNYNCEKYWLNWHQHCQKQYDCVAQQTSSYKQQSSSTTEKIELTNSNKLFDYEFDFNQNLTIYGNETNEIFMNEHNFTVMIRSATVASTYLPGNKNLNFVFFVIFVKKLIQFSV